MGRVCIQHVTNYLCQDSRRPRIAVENTVDPSEYTSYWFARDLIDSDQFGGYAKKEPAALERLLSELDKQLETNADLERLKQTIRSGIVNSVNKRHHGKITKRYRQTEDLAERVVRRIEKREDVAEFIIAAESVMRITEIMDETPRFGEDEIYEIVDKTLETDRGELDESRAFDAMYLVDVNGEAYQLGAQRAPLIEYVSELMEELRGVHDRDETDVSRIVSGIVQEYERRAGQSRSATAGNVLETGLQRIFDRFGIPATGVPEHFEDLEVDNIIRGPDGTLGFSCKRTLRERYKQSLQRQAEIGTDEIWFVSLLMEDVSREKVQTITNDGGRIYVPRDSFVWEQYNDDDDLSYSLRPTDRFLTDVAEFTGCQFNTAGVGES